MRNKWAYLCGMLPLNYAERYHLLYSISQFSPFNSHLSTDLSSVEEPYCPLRLFGLLLVVRDHDDGAAVLLIQAVEQLHHLGTHLRVEVTRRLVGKDDVRVADDGTCDGNTLALPAGKLRREMAHTVRQPDFLQDLLRHASTLLGAGLAVKERQFYIIQDVQRVNQVERLEDEAQAVVAEVGQLAVGHARRRRAGNLDGARGGRVKQPDEVQQRGFAAARGAHDTEEFTLFDRQVHVLQGDGFDLLRAVDLF